ncbi:MAG: type secretion system protein [Cyanobacteria bacterium RYN_339]|nr:type secretion system protein [Cyanobacteria bacterium RYN_339]
MCPTFESVSKDVDNRFVTKRLQAKNVKEARTQLRDEGMMPMDIKEIPSYKVWMEGMVAAVKKADQPNEEDLRREDDKKKRQAQVAELKKATGNKRWFKYECINDDTREEVVGHIKASDIKEARMALRDQRLIPKSISFDPFAAMHTDVGKGPKVKSEKNWDQSSLEKMWERIFPPKVTVKDLTLMAQQLAAITAAGLPIVQALHLLRDTLSNKYLQKIVGEMIVNISAGVSFGECIKEYRDVFPSLFIELVDMGEVTGNLDENMKRLAEYMAKQYELQQRVKGAMTYPLIVLGILVLIVVGLMIFIVPTFMKLFEEFHVTLPLATRVLLWMSWFVTHEWFTIPIILIPTHFLSKHVRRTALFKFLWDKVEYKIPILGDLNYKVQLTQMLSNLSMSLRSGLTVIRALDSLEENTRNHLMKEKVQEITENVKMGARLGVVVLAADIFPSLVNRLIAVGDETGGMDDMLQRAASYMDNEVQEAVKAMTAAIEPMMTLFLGGTVMFIVGALYFPLMGIMGGGHH